MSNPRLLKAIDRLILEGDAVLATTHDTRWSKDVVDPPALTKWLAGCRNLLRMLGHFAGPWEEAFRKSADYYEKYRAEQMQATLQAIRDAVEHGLLLDIEDLVLAEAFDSLLTQAEQLLAERRYLPAGVLGRAVLEEHLRKWCEHAECVPSRAKPTTSDYTQELYRKKQFNVSVLKHIESMAAIGNDAAHAKRELAIADVERLLRDLKDFLGRHSLAASIQ